ncbi:hypothetical protein L9F63_025519, partial [Diploptera punctata]
YLRTALSLSCLSSESSPISLNTQMDKISLPSQPASRSFMAFTVFIMFLLNL